MDRETVCLQTTPIVQTETQSINISRGQYDPRYVNMLHNYSMYLYLKTFLYIVTRGILQSDQHLYKYFKIKRSFYLFERIKYI